MKERALVNREKGGRTCEGVCFGGEESCRVLESQPVGKDKICLCPWDKEKDSK